ncbi:MAG: hypothetical protein HLUCCA12_18040 [Rhodobacteraceae bacterium HLUCCA12]|nr:MAG: hypothetical protein HLUCCA12_18040 [Rhodobacteraceae bacterium HLUCCA12]
MADKGFRMLMGTTKGGQGATGRGCPRIANFVSQQSSPSSPKWPAVDHPGSVTIFAPRSVATTVCSYCTTGAAGSL